MRISDWSSDVCSSDLAELHPAIHPDAVHHLDHAIGARLDHHARPFGVRRTVGKPGGEPSPIIGRHAIGEIHALCPGFARFVAQPRENPIITVVAGITHRNMSHSPIYPTP